MTAADTVVTQARGLLQMNRAEDAARILTGHLSEYPHDVSALTLLASANLQRNRAAEALRNTDDALAVDPGYPAAWQHRSMALRQLGRHEDAVAAGEQFVGLAPNLWASHYTLGLVLRGLPQRRGAALGPAARAVELAPDHADPYVLLGLVYSDAQDFGLAAQYYRRALAIDPEHAFATSNLSGLDLRKGRFRKAMRGFRAAAAASPQEEVFHRNIVATVFGSLVKYGLLIAVLTVFAALVAASADLAGGGWWPRIVVLVVLACAWATLLTSKLRPLSPYLRRQLRSAVATTLRTWRFRLFVAGFVVNQVCAFLILLDPALRPPLPDLLTTVANLVLLGAMLLGRVIRRPGRVPER
ncbi:MAG TPA: tetratricopeptide repeat protein [Pseudonocardiaceae bacterium]|nr:tetratricopeptide repeat protein [Pseudonocardiaceae bacterium]